MKKLSMVLMSVGIVVLVVIAGVAVYYYGFYLPGVQRERVQQEQEKIQQEQMRQAREAVDEAYREAALSECLDSAYQEYDRRFKSVVASYERAWNDKCKQLGLPPDSALPTDVAEPLYDHHDREIERTEEAYQRRMDECFRMYGE